MVANVDVTLTRMAAGTAVAGIATNALGLLLIPGAGWLFAAFLLFAGALIEAGAVATYAAFTEEVYEWLLCAFYDELDDDGRITGSGLQSVVDAAAVEQPNPLVAGFLDMIVKAHGFVGFNNAGTTYANPEADCGSCAAWCFAIDLELGDGGFVVQVGAGVWTSGVGIESTDIFLGVNRTLIEGYFPFGEDVYVNTIDVHYDYHKITSNPLTEGVGVWEYDFANPLFSEDQGVAEDGDDLSINISSGIPQPITGISFFLQPAYNAHGGNAIIRIVQVTGTGEPPVWFEANGWDPC